jgi:ATP-binding cassette subfamily F protein 3
MESIIKAQGLTKTIGNNILFQHVSFNINSQDCIGLIGPNGSGKTTLLRLILQEIRPSSGELWVKNDLIITYVPQVLISNPEQTIEEYIQEKSNNNVIYKRIEAIDLTLQDYHIYNTPEYDRLVEKRNYLRAALVKTSSVFCYDNVKNDLQESGMNQLFAHKKISSLSTGERQKLILSCAFLNLKETHLLLLDEPTNHLDIPSIEWFEKHLSKFQGAILLITHDRYLLDNFAERMFEINNHQIDVYNIPFEIFEEQKQILHHIRVQQYNKYCADVQKRESSIEKMTRRNRFNAQVSSKIQRMQKIKKIPDPGLKNYFIKYQIKSLSKSGKNIADGSNITKSYRDIGILKNTNFEIFSGQKIGLIGRNGCGKTTFLKLLIGEEEPDSGTIKLSKGVRYGYFDQDHRSLKLDNSLIKEVRRSYSNLTENDAKALLGHFRFKGTDVDKTIEQLSGGEQSRLALLQLFLQPTNFLILDEPTNHMDIESIGAIEQALIAYDGTILLVSHDRRFLDMVTDFTFLMINGKIQIYKGNFSSSRFQRQQKYYGSSHVDEELLYGINIKKYVVKKSFTDWNTGKKYKVGDIISIGDYNYHLFEWAINSGRLKIV